MPSELRDNRTRKAAYYSLPDHCEPKGERDLSDDPKEGAKEADLGGAPGVKLGRSCTAMTLVHSLVPDDCCRHCGKAGRPIIMKGVEPSGIDYGMATHRNSSCCSKRMTESIPFRAEQSSHRDLLSFS